MRTRDLWGGGARPRRLEPVTHPYLEVHHDVYPLEWSGDRHARAIESQHLGQGWNGAFYNLGIAADGELYELRGWGFRCLGAGTAAYYHDGTPVSRDAATVVLFGNFETDHPTADQLARLEELRRQVPDQRLRWHGMRPPATACCGRHLIAHLNRTYPPSISRSSAVEICSTPTGDGYWIAADDGGVFAYGNAQFHGSVPQLIAEGKMGPLAAPIIGMDATPTGNGYRLLGADGGVFCFGDAGMHGSAVEHLRR